MIPIKLEEHEEVLSNVDGPEYPENKDWFLHKQ